MNSWAEWPRNLIEMYTLGMVLPLISYASTWAAKVFELMVIVPLAWLRYNDWQYQQTPPKDTGFWGTKDD